MYLIDRSNKNISAQDVDLIGASSGFGKTKLSAAMLALIAAGASAPVMMSQFQDERRPTPDCIPGRCRHLDNLRRCDDGQRPEGR